MIDTNGLLTCVLNRRSSYSKTIRRTERICRRDIGQRIKRQNCLCGLVNPRIGNRVVGELNCRVERIEYPHITRLREISLALKQAWHCDRCYATGSFDDASPLLRPKEKCLFSFLVIETRNHYRSAYEITKVVVA